MEPFYVVSEQCGHGLSMLKQRTAETLEKSLWTKKLSIYMGREGGLLMTEFSFLSVFKSWCSAQLVSMHHPRLKLYSPPHAVFKLILCVREVYLKYGHY